MGEQAAEAAKAALSLLGNATAQISRERRKKVILSLNKKVHPLAEDEDTFAEAAPATAKCLTMEWFYLVCAPSGFISSVLLKE